MNWNPTAYPGGTSLKPLKIDLIWVLTEHTIKDLLASLTILYCVGRDLMAAPFSSTNIGIGLFEDDIFFYFTGLRCFYLRFLGLCCFEMMYFLLSGSSTLPLNQQLTGATGFFRTSSDWGVSSVCFLSSRKRVGSLGGKGARRPGRKEGIPIHLRQCR